MRLNTCHTHIIVLSVKPQAERHARGSLHSLGAPGLNRSLDQTANGQTEKRPPPRFGFLGELDMSWGTFTESIHAANHVQGSEKPFISPGWKNRWSWQMEDTPSKPEEPVDS